MIRRPVHFHAVSEFFTLLCEWTARDAAGVPGLRQMDWGRVVRKGGKGPSGEGGGEGVLCAGRGSPGGGGSSGFLSLEFVSADTDVGVRSSCIS